MNKPATRMKNKKVENILPNGWQRTRLGDIGVVKSGSTPARSQHERYFVGGKWPWVKTMDLTNAEILTTDELITDAALEESACKLCSPGTVLVAMYGGFKQIGRTGLLTRESAVNQAISAIELDLSRAHPEFVLHWLNGNIRTWRSFAASSRKDPNITRENVCDFPVNLPPLAEQRRIAQVLSTWDRAIGAMGRLLANRQRGTRDLMTSLLSGHRRFPGMLDKWREVDFDSVFERVTRKNTTQNTNVLTISAEYGLISQRDYFHKSVASANLAGYTLLQKQDFAYNKSYSAGYPMGAIKPLLAYDAGVVSSLYLCFRLRGDVDADFDFFRHYFEAGLLNQEIEGIAQEGARNHGLLNVSVTDFFKLQLHVPSAPEQRRIAEVINVAKAEEARLAAQLQFLRQEKAALMFQLLTGKRRVKMSEAGVEAATEAEALA